LPITIVACPIIRESDGLAMSSRNTLLSPEERKAAAIIPQLLMNVKTWKEEGKLLNEIKQNVESALSKNNLYKLEYFEICDRNSLVPLLEITPNSKALALIACYVGKIRLIDNLEV
jgi:pantoate--beta-alanine ligase